MPKPTSPVRTGPANLRMLTMGETGFPADSENIIFVDGVAHKLAEVTFHMNTQDYMRPWRFSSSDGCFEMAFSPAVDRNSAINLGLIRSLQHQVIGYFSGTLVLDDGRMLRGRPLFGFCRRRAELVVSADFT